MKKFLTTIFLCGALVVNALAGSPVAKASGTVVLPQKQITASNVITAKPAVDFQLNKKVCAMGYINGGWWVYDCDSGVLLIVYAQ